MENMSKPQLQLERVHGNAFVILGRAQRVLRDNGYSAQAIQEFMNEATAGDYDALLRVVADWFDVS